MMAKVLRNNGSHYNGWDVGSGEMLHIGEGEIAIASDAATAELVADFGEARFEVLGDAPPQVTDAPNVVRVPRTKPADGERRKPGRPAKQKA